QRPVAEHSLDVVPVGTEVSLLSVLAHRHARDERLRRVAEVGLAALPVVMERLLPGPLVERELQLEVLRQLPPRPVDGPPAANLIMEARLALLTPGAVP